MNIIGNSDKLVVSITSTSRCNCQCSYCHFYAGKKMRRKRRDVSKETIVKYAKFIDYLKNNRIENIDVRFSGGEPLVLEDKLFEYANIIYKYTGIKPYVLTNGKALNEEVIKKSISNNISSYVISLENPFNQDEFSVDVEENIKKIQELNSLGLRLYPGVVIVKNSMFKKLPDICDYFFEKIGSIPTISELNFDYFEVPTEEELNDLYNSIYTIVKKYYGITQLKLFPYIVPALNNLDVENEWLIEFTMENTLNIEDDFEKAFETIQKKVDSSFPVYKCRKCDLQDDCKRVKWLWKLSSEREKAYCIMKKNIVNAYFDALK